MSVGSRGTSPRDLVGKPQAEKKQVTKQSLSAHTCLHKCKQEDDQGTLVDTPAEYIPKEHSQATPNIPSFILRKTILSIASTPDASFSGNKGCPCRPETSTRWSTAAPVPPGVRGQGRCLVRHRLQSHASAQGQGRGRGRGHSHNRKRSNRGGIPGCMAELLWLAHRRHLPDLSSLGPENVNIGNFASSCTLQGIYAGSMIFSSIRSQNGARASSNRCLEYEPHWLSLYTFCGYQERK